MADQADKAEYDRVLEELEHANKKVDDVTGQRNEAIKLSIGLIEEVHYLRGKLDSSSEYEAKKKARKRKRQRIFDWVWRIMALIALTGVTLNLFANFFSIVFGN